MKDFGIHTVRNVDGTYSVAFYFRPVMEEMFELAVHVARFRDLAGAVRLAGQVKVAFLNRANKSMSLIDCVDKRYWQGPTSVCAAVRWDAEADAYCVMPQKLVA
jgi:hypothetical protein